MVLLDPDWDDALPAPIAVNRAGDVYVDDGIAGPCDAPYPWPAGIIRVGDVHAELAKSRRLFTRLSYEPRQAPGRDASSDAELAEFIRATELRGYA